MIINDNSAIHNPAPLNGLVLAGGKSERMGQNKAAINWHGKEQQFYIADLLKEICHEVFISCRKMPDILYSGYAFLEDTFTGLGPYGAILTAFEQNSNCAWLVVACDLPLLNSETLRYLTTHRNPHTIATTFRSPFDNLPEPLITIWEPKCYPVLQSFLSEGISCPRKALINSDTSILEVPDPRNLMNVNTPSEVIEAKRILHEINKQYAGC